MSKDSSDIGAFLSGFVIGGLVGAAVALIMAPQSGEETRAQIRQKSVEIKDQSSEAYQTARTRAAEGYETARVRVTETTAEVRTRAEKLAADAKKAAEAQIDKVNVTIEKVRGSKQADSTEADASDDDAATA